MLDPAIQAFFDERRQAWLDKAFKTTKNEEKRDELRRECDEHYSLRRWLRFALDNSGKRSLVSHVSKMTHPDTGSSKTNMTNRTYVTPILFEGTLNSDGYLRTGNVSNWILDSTGNGTEVNTVGEVGLLLSLVLSDGHRFYEHLTENSNYLDEFFIAYGFDAADSKSALSEMFKTTTVETNSKIKQVYFPLFPEEGEDGVEYHLLSVLTNSGLVFELRKRLDALRFGFDPEKASEHIKQSYLSKDELRDARKARKEGKPHKNYDEVYDLTSIAYGGKKPQNISVLNNQNGGTAHLLMSAPPLLAQREVRFPKQDFFTQSIRFVEAREGFQALHRIFATHAQQSDIPLKNLVNARDSRLNDLLDIIVERMWAVRAVAAEQYHEPSSALKPHQAIWLLQENEAYRLENDDWLDKVLSEISQWLIAGYKKVLKEPVPLGDAEDKFIHDFVQQFKEALR